MPLYLLPWVGRIIVIAMVLELVEAYASDFNFITIDVPGALSSHANGINDRGSIVGSYTDTQGDHGYLDMRGRFTTIDVPSQSSAFQDRVIGTVPFGVNNSGTIVGTFSTVTTAGNGAGFSDVQGNFRQLTGEGGGIFGINARGDMVGVVCGICFRSPGLLIDRNGQVTNFSAPGARQTVAFGINASGQIVGAADEHGFLDTNGHFTIIDVPGATSTTARGINNQGEIVGTFTNGTGTHGFLDIHNTIITVDVPGARSTTVTGVNNRGLFVGSFADSNGQSHGFVDPPSEVPEPGTLFLLASGVGWLALSNKRK